MLLQNTTTVVQVNTLFQKNLPQYPYATNDFSDGLFRHRRVDAPKYKYIQHNPSNSIHSIVVDIDHDVYPDDIEPRPNIVVSNKDNAKAHAIYLLKPGVHLNEHSKRKPIVFAESVMTGLTRRLGGDPSYSHLICKNPLNDSYRIHSDRAELYDLTELADWLPSKSLNKQPSFESSPYGRNSQVFDWCRSWAYIAIRQYVTQSFEDFHTGVLTRCVELNLNVYLPMTLKEIKTIAKSISTWVWARRYRLTDHSKQRHRSKKGNAIKTAKSKAKQEQALEMFARGIKALEVADTLGITIRTARSYKAMLSNQR